MFPLILILFINDTFLFTSINIEFFLCTDDTVILISAGNDEGL